MSRAAAAAPSSSNYNICLICGSHTDLVLNIFEPRCGPNIVDIIFAKFKFKAEKNSADKFICYDCNNWLINWFSLQNVNETSERSSGGPREIDRNINAKKPLETSDDEIIATTRIGLYVPDFNEYLKEKHKEMRLKKKPIEVAAVAKSLEKRKVLFKRKRLFPVVKRKGFYLNPYYLTKNPSFRRQILRKYNRRPCRNGGDNMHRFDFKETKQNHISSHKNIDYNGVESEPQASNFDNHILTMLRNQGTILVKEQKCNNDEDNDDDDYNDDDGEPLTFTPLKTDAPSPGPSSSNEIVIHFNTAITEVFPLDLSEHGFGHGSHVMIDDSQLKIPKGLSISLSTD